MANETDINEEYCRVITPENSMSEESEEVCSKILESLDLREKWLFQVAENRHPANRTVHCSLASLVSSVFFVFKNLADAVFPSDIPDYSPLAYVPLSPTTLKFAMEDGVFRIKENISGKEMFSLPGQRYDSCDV